MELSGHEWQRAEEVLGWGGAKGAQGRGKARGCQNPVVSTHSSDRQPYPWGSAGGHSSLIWREEGQLSKCMGVGRGGPSPLASLS